MGARIRLGVAFALFGAWVGWLGYQALTRGRFPVVSRAQLLVSTLDAIASVHDSAGKPDPVVTIEEVHWPPERAALKGTQLTVRNMADANGYIGPGQYILPLVRIEGDTWAIAGLPTSPGFDPGEHSPHFIYPLTPLTRQQLAAITKR